MLRKMYQFWLQKVILYLAQLQIVSARPFLSSLSSSRCTHPVEIFFSAASSLESNLSGDGSSDPVLLGIFVFVS